ncbi:MAG: class II aldolase/adducin family protein, partial [Spirochaetaceae bacterium]|nr:class II aldolase/adducin family protein [Spirochaetaceae bacterium]
MNDLIKLSREYGSDPGWVVAGGGNTSWKDGDVLYVKASGYPLATIGEDGFARMDRRKLAAIWETAYPEGDDAADVAERERLVLQDMMNARIPGEERRPSVETLLHDLLPWPLVVHLHPTLVNGLTCGVDGPQKAKELFGNDAVWIPVTDPGYILAKVIKESLEDRTSRGLSIPDYIFLANHGVFAGGDDAEEVRQNYE